jgi:hypothetical protein
LFVFALDWQMEPFQAFGSEPSPKQLRFGWRQMLVVSTKEPAVEEPIIWVVAVVVIGVMPKSKVDARSPADGFPGEQARSGGQPRSEMPAARAAVVVVVTGLERQPQVADPTTREHLYLY